MLYLAHMFYLGRTNLPLTDNLFEAWDYGPVEPMLYRKVRAFGTEEIPDIMSSAALYEPGTAQYAAISDVYKQVGKARPGRLVAITHWDGGAWAKNYRPNVLGIKIPNEDVRAEYATLVERAAAKQQHESAS
jgi:uncharacterized phage-associated protein